MRERTARAVHRGSEVMEGAGVRLRRMIGVPELDHVDPFLLLDEFRSDDPDDYIAGFPWHPHRGIETVTYMVRGEVRHGDSLGNRGTIGPGDVQWMTAGHGIIHEEMPQQREGGLWGFQLWVNLPRRLKMCDPRYQDVPAARVPAVDLGAGARARVVAGELGGVKGPVTEIAASPLFADLHLDGAAVTLPVLEGLEAFCHVYDGGGRLAGEPVSAPALVVLGDGDALRAEGELRFLLAAGRELREPIARGGPFVMNTSEEIARAFQDYRDGKLLK